MEDNRENVDNEKNHDSFLQLKKNNQLEKKIECINKTNNISKINNPLEKLKLPTHNISENLVNSLCSSMNGFHSAIESIVQKQLSIINSKMIESMTNPLFNAINQIAESQKALMNTVISTITINNPLFESLYQSLEEARANPNSIYSWFDYYDKLSEFFWIMPYQMSANQLHEILMNIKTEKEFDRYISKYFNKEKVNSLIGDIKKMMDSKQELKLFDQIVLSYNNKSYSLASMGLMSLIDNLLSYYLLNKGCNSRIKIFEPIIEDLDRKRKISDDFTFIVMMINSNINLLYEDIEFNDKIKIKTNKKARRNPVSHGKSYSNKKIDTIMLLNTLYYLLVSKSELKEYKSSLCYDRNKKEFYFPNKEQKKQLKNKIKDNIMRKNEK